MSRDLMTDIAGADMSGPPRFTDCVIHDPDLAKRLLELHEADKFACPLDWQSDVLDTLQKLAQSHLEVASRAPEPQDTAASKRMTIYEPHLLANMCGLAPELNSLAEKGGVHVNQVIRDFRQVHGITPGEFLRMKRLEHAKLALGRGTTITDAAMEAGFADQSHFTRMFRRAYGMTPSVYQRLGVGTSSQNPL